MKASMLLRALAVAAGFAVGAAGAVWLVLWVSLRSSAVRVPDVQGQDTSRAVATLQDAGLVARLQEGVFDPELASGRVARQRPGPGFQLKRGGIVLLYPSLGEAAVRVADLGGLPVAVAELELEHQGLHVGARCELEGQSDAVVVVAQAPPPGSLVPPATPIDVVVNRSPRLRRYVMPDFVGQPESVAAATIRTLGFRLAVVQGVSYPGMAEGTVLRQDPPAGGPVAEAAVAGLWVSR